jgi:hypothetical protein
MLLHKIVALGISVYKMLTLVPCSSSDDMGESSFWFWHTLRALFYHRETALYPFTKPFKLDTYENN